jgi:hypothetical protein
MQVEVTYPLFAFEKDDHSMHLIEDSHRILYHFEAIDIENDEYVFWDANGGGVSISVSVGAFKSKLVSVTSCPPAFPLHDAFVSYTKTLGLPESAAEGTPMDVLRMIHAELESRPKKRNFLSKLFAG